MFLPDFISVAIVHVQECSDQCDTCEYTHPSSGTHNRKKMPPSDKSSRNLQCPLLPETLLAATTHTGHRGVPASASVGASFTNGDETSLIEGLVLGTSVLFSEVAVYLIGYCIAAFAVIFD